MTSIARQKNTADAVFGESCEMCTQNRDVYTTEQSLSTQRLFCGILRHC